MENYKKIKQLGKGSYGAAWLVQRREDRTYLVVKEINVSRMGRKERAEVKNEVTVLSRLQCPHITRYVDSFMYRHGLCIAMEYADGGDLEKALKSRRGKLLSEERILDWFIQICIALKYIHNRKILHRDLKPANIFLTRNGLIKLGDFGIAKVLDNTMQLAKTAIGTPYYLSPEICREQRYNNKSDIWSLGCVLYEMCSLRHAFEASNMKGLVRAITRGQYAPISSRYSKELAALVDSCLRVDPRKRPRVDRLLATPIVQRRIEHYLKSHHIREEFNHTIMHGVKATELPVQRTPPRQAARNAGETDEEDDDDEREFAKAVAASPAARVHALEVEAAEESFAAARAEEEKIDLLMSMQGARAVDAVNAARRRALQMQVAERAAAGGATAAEEEEEAEVVESGQVGHLEADEWVDSDEDDDADNPPAGAAAGKEEEEEEEDPVPVPAPRRPAPAVPGREPTTVMRRIEAAGARRDDPTFHKLEAVKAHLEATLGFDKFLEAYTACAHARPGEARRAVVAVVGADKADVVPLLQHLVITEQAARDRQSRGW